MKMTWVGSIFVLLTISTVDCYWKPTPLTNWTWQLSGKIDTTKNVVMYDIDLWDTPVDTITTLKRAGKIVICYFRYNLMILQLVSRITLCFSAGSFENWRSDKNLFPDSVKGNQLHGWSVSISHSRTK